LLHFGIGDAAFLTELNQLKGIPKRKFSVIPIFLAFGAVPVLIPLLNSKSSVALKEINPNLIYWDQNFARVLWVVLSILIAIAILTLILTKRVRDLIDLFLLLALAILTPPLISFAIYFGCWHAMRHTARLTLVLPKSNEEFKLNRPLNAFWAAVLPGTPALLFTFLAAIYLWQRESIENSLLWSMLVIVWALTVPHMMVTARLDKAALA
jgi:Brp/Blh family beta-carotene 15,15'-monooxygenase